jgi:hypothetical protein
VSAVALVGLAALWVLSSTARPPSVAWGDPHNSVGRTLGVSRGRLVLRSEWAKRPMALDANTRAIQMTWSRTDAPGFARSRTTWVPETVAGARLPGTFGVAQETRLSLAWPLVVSVGCCAWTFARLRRHWRLPPGRCPACGYDLRATPQEGGALLSRCPECGAVPAAAAGG